MKNYRFKHESVLNYRAQVEDGIKIEFIELQRTLAGREVRFAEICETFDVKSAEILAEDTFSPNDRDNYNGYLQFLKVQMAECKESIESVTEEVDKKREELMNASKDKKILEVIKDKGRVMHIKAEEKSEQSVNDEFNIHKYSK